MFVRALLRKWFGSMPQPLPAMRQHHVRCVSGGNAAGFHQMAYTEWGDPNNPDVVVCVHGLTRNARDFDDLARALSRDFRVVCPDVVGRGQSDWLKDPNGYGFPQYIADMTVLLARLNVERVRWVGTSMGGIIGMLLASFKDSPISRLVLNDVGPLITADSLRRIGEYVGKAPAFDDFAAAEAYIRAVSAPFGDLTDAQWRHLAEHSVRQDADGKWRMRYDPGIGEPFRQAFVFQDVDLWPVYEAILVPVLLLRGAESDLLRRDTAQAMTERGPKARWLDIPGVGHAPALMDEVQIRSIVDFLKADKTPRPG